MTVNIYPDSSTAALLGKPANKPINLAANEAMNNFVPLAGNAGPDPDAFNLNTTFIRIALSGPASATLPHVELLAHNPEEGTDGPAKVITAESIAAAQGLADGSAANPTDAATAYFAGPPYANNVYLLKVVINIAGTTLKLRVTNDATARNYVWVVADTGDGSRKPWINADPAALTYDALVNQTAAQTAQSVQVANSGTGDLVINSVAPAIAAPFELMTALPVTLAPNSTANLAIGFKPTAIGNLPVAAFTLNSTDAAPGVGNPGHNNQLKLSGKTGALEIALVLDDSGSMSTKPDGSFLPAQSPLSRWSELTSAAKSFLELLAAFGENRGKFGVLKFPGKTGSPVGDLTSYDLVPAQTIPAVGGMSSAKSLLDAVVPFNGTPMNPGLQRALTSPAPYFATDADSLSLNRRWMLLMTDGAWNDGGDPTSEIPQLSSNKITVFAAGYGTGGEVNYGTLQSIASGTGGQATQVDSGGGTSATALATSFKTAIKNGLTSVSSPGDPMAVLGAGSRSKTKHPIIITPYDSRATFMINWNTPDAERMQLELLTPNGELLKGRDAGVAFSRDSRYQMFAIDESYLRNDADPANPRYGTWWMLVSSPELASSRNAQDREDYSYDVMLESSLKMQVALDRGSYFAGDTIGVSARLTVDGLPLKHAAVKLDLTAPGQSMDNWLAQVPITPEEYKRALSSLDGKDASPIYVKAVAARLKKIFFKGVSQTSSIPMLDAQDSGTYSAVVSQTSVPDGHKLYLTAIGSTEEGILFRREHAIDVMLSVRADPKSTLVDVIYSKVSDVIQAILRITPRDRFGNYILIDPARSRDFILKVDNAEIGRVTTTFDGTYSAPITYRTGTQPAISLVINGKPVLRGRPLPAIDKLKYVDQLITFKPGLEGAPGANKHADPKAALGEIFAKPSDQFVSLGAYGAVTVGVKGGVFVGQGDDDFTVFTHIDADPRSYLVEAQDADSGAWVKLANSAGGTDSFSLRDAHLKAASAIRITDTSGRTRDAALRPLEAPGASILAIGAAKVEARSSIPKFAATPNQFNPKFGTAGLSLTLFGSNFNNGTVSVRFGGVDAQVVTATSTQIVVIVPSIPAGATKITVRTDDGLDISDDVFTVV